MGQLINKLKRAIKRHVQAEIDLSWKGGMHPDDWEDIEKEAATAKRKLEDVLRDISMKLSDPER